MTTLEPFAKQPKGGFFISFEGGEGSGKSTQAALLGDQLRTEGYDVLETREPGGSPAGRIVREVLLAGHAADKGALAEACLLTSARREHVDFVIRPALARNQVVICDRFADSTRIYQGYVGGLSKAVIDRLEAVATDGLLPEVTYVLDVNTYVARDRRQQRIATKGDGEDRFEKEDQSFHDKVADGFRKLSKDNPGRCFLIDGNGKAKNVAVTIRDSLRLRGLI